MVVTFLQTTDVGGRRFYAGDNVDLPEQVAQQLVREGAATVDVDGRDGGAVSVQQTASGPVLQSGASEYVLSQTGGVTSGVWRNLPNAGVLMRVRLTGTGSVSMDSATGYMGAGTVTTAVYAALVAGAQIDDFAYPGDLARSIRFTLSGTAAVEVY